MSFIRAKEIPPGSGRWYDYEVEDYREGEHVKQRIIRYIGRSGGIGTTGGGGHVVSGRHDVSPIVGTTITERQPSAPPTPTQVQPKQLMGTTPEVQPPTSSNELSKGLGTTKKEIQIGDYRYSLDGLAIRRGTVVNESWVGEGPNAVKWEGGGVNSNMGMTEEEAETKLKGLKQVREQEQQRKDERYHNQVSQLDIAIKASPKSKILQSFKIQLSPRNLLSPKQMDVVTKVVSKTPYKPPQKGKTRTIFRGGEKVVQFYVRGTGWVDESEVHEYQEYDNLDKG